MNMEKIQSYISQLTFDNAEPIEINANDIVIFVGPNNAGKSQMLQDIRRKAEGDVPTVIISDVILTKSAGSLYEYLNSIAQEEKKGSYSNYHVMGKTVPYSQESDERFKVEPRLGTVTDFFIANLTTENRLTICKQTSSITPDSPKMHPIHYAAFDEKFSTFLSENFKRAFGKGIIVDTHYGAAFTLRISDDIILTEEYKNETKRQAAYAKKLGKCHKIQNQGDGIKSFTGILLYLMLDYYYTYLIDEPEAFLHPPQAKILGNILGKTLSSRQQAFISTHSADFIKGVLESASDRVKIVRITRPKENENKFSILNNEKISDLWQDPLLKHSDIMDGMFYKNVVICESDADCRFYSMINSFLKEQQQKFSETLFVHCGGKGRMKKVVQALRSLNIDFRVVPDIDLLNNKQALIDLVEACGETWDKDIDYNTLVDGLEKVKNSTGNEILEQMKNELGANVTQPLSRTQFEKLQKLLVVKTNWDQIKRFGIAGAPPGQATQSLNNLLHFLKRLNIHLVPCGELECFIKTIGGHGPDWLNNVLEKYPDIGADEYIAARNFVASWNL